MCNSNNYMCLCLLIEFGSIVLLSIVVLRDRGCSSKSEIESALPLQHNIEPQYGKSEVYMPYKYQRGTELDGLNALFSKVSCNRS